MTCGSSPSTSTTASRPRSAATTWPACRGWERSLVTYRPEEQLHTRLIRIGLEDFGDPDLLSHTLLHAYPLHVALRFDVPLVLLGRELGRRVRR